MPRLHLAVLATLLSVAIGRGCWPTRLPFRAGGAGAVAMSAAQAPRGFIGLGIMGKGMARCLLRAGYPLHVWTRNAEVSAALQAENIGPVTIALSPAEVVRACDRTFLMLSTPEVCNEVYSMSGGVLEGIANGKSLVDCATLRPEDMQFLEAEVLARGGRFIEAPVSGSKGPAEEGTLIFMTAGDEALASEVAGEMDAMGKASHYCGETGAASKMKLVVNMIMGGMIAALAEGIALSQALALDGGQMQQILEQGAMSSPMLKLKGPNMAEGVHPSAFPLKYAQKDMRFALAEAGRAGLVLPVAKAASDEMVASMDQGNGDADFSAVVEALRGARRG